MSNDTDTIDPLEVTDEELQALGDPGKRALDRIRGHASKLAEDAAKVPDLVEKLSKYERREALTDAELAELNEDQQEALLSTHQRKGREMTADDLRQTAVELGYAEPQEHDVPAEEVAAHKRIASVAGNDRTKQSTAITPDEARSWTPDKMRRFMKEHPAEWESLKRGETVSGVVFT